MINYIFRDTEGKTWKQVNKAAARKLYDAGSVVKVCAANLRPGFPYNPEATIDKATLEEINAGPISFDNFVRQYDFFNCINSETGKYSRYYVEA